MSDLKFALSYSLPPYKLGFCGPQDKESKKVIFDFLTDKKVNLKKIIKILQEFKSVYSYYKLIAKSNKIKAPFDRKVIEAYWLGNKLLDQVKFSDLKKMILTQFVGPNLLSQEKALKIINKVPSGILPHHSFHVLFIGSITGRIELKGKLLDLCRISWGQVKSVNKQQTTNNSKIVVEYQPLVVKKNLVYLGKPINKEIIWPLYLPRKNNIPQLAAGLQDKLIQAVEYNAPHEFIRGSPKIKKGNFVSFHWNMACDRLSKSQVKNLEKYTCHHLKLLRG